MAWATPPVFVSGNTLTAAQLNILGADLNETAPAKASASGQLFVSTAANVIAARTPTGATVATQESTSTVVTYGDLATVGPAVTATTGTAAILAYGATSSPAGAGGSLMSYAVSGATTIAAPAGYPAAHGLETGAAVGTASSKDSPTMVFYQTGLISGSNTFTSKYTTPTGGSCAFFNRSIVVIPL